MPETRPASGLLREMKSLGAGSFTYLVPTFLTRGLTFVLTPVYTRYMSPADYGIVGLAATLPTILALLLGWSVHSSTYRLHHTLPDDAARVRLNGTVLAFLLTVPVAITVLLEVLGSFGVLHPFQSLPYTPYLRLVVWTGLFAMYQGLAINLLMVREQHRRAALLNAVSVVLVAGLTVLFVVVLRRGAFGQLLATFLAGAFIAAWSIWIAWRFGKPTYDRALLKEALVFAIPLVPHHLSSWMLALSDRAILERYVTTAELGRYTLGYTFGATVAMFVGATSQAFFPIVSRKLAEKDPNNEVPYLGSVVIVTTGFAALGAAAVFPSFIRLVTPASYHGSTPIVPWVALGYFFQALLGVWAQGTFFAKRTGAVAAVTLAGAVTNIGLNLVLVPRYGIYAAAVTTAVGYGVMAVLHALVARKSHPIAWEHGRLLRILLAGGIAYAIAVSVPGMSPALELFFRLGVVVIAFPLLLVLVRAFRPSEVRRVRSLLAARRAKAAAPAA
jgi:O-antigen/teichoic acid export membrane protein